MPEDEAALSPSDFGGRTQSIYERRFAQRDDYRDRVWRVLCSKWFAKWIRPTDSIIDVGAGYCEFINNIQGGRKIAMDLNPDTHQRAAEGVEVLLHDCAQPWPVPAGSLDVVFTSNFLEHLPSRDLVLQTARHAFAALKDGGVLVAMGPNVRAVPGAYWDFFDHYIPLTDRSVAEMLALAGFEIEVCHARFLPYSMSQGRQVPVAFVAAYLRFRPAWRLLGKQFLVVARKKGS